MGLEIVPISISDAKAYVLAKHRHHPPPTAGLFAVGCSLDGEIRGVAIIGNPVATGNVDGFTAEVSRVATDGTPNACSILYGAAWRACRSLGYRRLITYTLVEEPGTSLRAAGWRCLGEIRGKSWSHPSRPRVDKHPLQNKIKWERRNAPP